MMSNVTPDQRRGRHFQVPKRLEHTKKIQPFNQIISRNSSTASQRSTRSANNLISTYYGEQKENSIAPTLESISILKATKHAHHYDPRLSDSLQSGRDRSVNRTRIELIRGSGASLSSIPSSSASSPESDKIDIPNEDDVDEEVGEVVEVQLASIQGHIPNVLALLDDEVMSEEVPHQNLNIQMRTQQRQEALRELMQSTPDTNTNTWFDVVPSGNVSETQNRSRWKNVDMKIKYETISNDLRKLSMFNSKPMVNSLKRIMPTEKGTAQSFGPGSFVLGKGKDILIDIWNKG
ncbi:unnamed protein product [Kuraishia capsulata CBS 1993]|uniref:Uncharacterized protein n=1 Tax=Kuraishia capsulata CBS 1993 TaxID=1382522 RepID=W6MMU8_9ASCO|nr:uncharacterized protein KUCA_T00002293001 [Kuraishia capsulata CBS 1993]CDK26322.1 unnamed protein product [Kuraishia capsulata CBS 1993]